MKDKVVYNMLWIFKHVDIHTILDEPIKDRNNFVLQNFFDYLCSKPVVEIIFLKDENREQADLDILAVKKINF